MARYSEGNMISQREQSRIDKEAMKKMNQRPISKPKTESIGFDYKECGLKNTCVFGDHNDNFRKTK